jgi:hypothetical protein
VNNYRSKSVYIKMKITVLFHVTEWNLLHSNQGFGWNICLCLQVEEWEGGCLSMISFYLHWKSQLIRSRVIILRYLIASIRLSSHSDPMPPQVSQLSSVTKKLQRLWHHKSKIHSNCWNYLAQVVLWQANNWMTGISHRWGRPEDLWSAPSFLSKGYREFSPRAYFR